MLWKKDLVGNIKLSLQETALKIYNTQGANARNMCKITSKKCNILNLPHCYI